jgi:hypothetical protein
MESRFSERTRLIRQILHPGQPSQEAKTEANAEANAEAAASQSESTG